jgi:imidazolonepropionase-like amidohydrolase
MMKRRACARWMGCVAFIFLFGIAGTRFAHSSAEGESVEVFEGAKVYTSPTEPPIENGTIVIRGGKVEAVGKSGRVSFPQNAVRRSFKNEFIVAGFQNSHVHFTESKWDEAEKMPAPELTQRLFDMLVRHGFTAAVDLGSFLENTVAIRRRIESGEVAGPRILSAGGGMYPPNGAPYYLRGVLPPEILKLLPQPETEEEAVEIVRREIGGGADVIKLFTGSLVERGQVKLIPEPIAAAAVAEAHRQNRLVFAHPSNIDGAMVAIHAQVDVLSHTTSVAGIWSEEMIAQMKRQKMSLVPTLKLWKYEAAKSGATAEEQFAFQSRAAKNLTAYAAAGGQILFGTDVGYMTDYDTTEEFSAMARAGMTPMQILASLTTAPAERFGESGRRGRIVPGMDADLVVLEGDPAVDAGNFAKVRATYRAGKPQLRDIPSID